MNAPPAVLHWTENGMTHSARWRSERGVAAPARVLVADDRITADAALRTLRGGSALLWRGDFHNARQLLQALGRRLDRAAPAPRSADPAALFRAERRGREQRATLLGGLLVPLEADYGIPLRRAPDVQDACREAWGEPDPAAGPAVVALRELQGLIGAHQWRRRGVSVTALGAAIHPHYGVYSPVRGEYLDLVAAAPVAQLPAGVPAFDIGTGTGVLAALLARRGIARIVATDTSARALACAGDNLQRLGLAATVELVATDLFPAGRAALAVCNPPWLPGQPHGLLDCAIYDPGSRMLRGFLAGLRDHLVPGGEGWLILSDLAERLGLRAAGELEALFADNGLRVIDRLETRPRHPRASDATDALHSARAGEITSLWRLAAAASQPP